MVPKKGRPYIVVRDSEETIALVKADAARLDVSDSDVVRDALRAWFMKPEHTRKTTREHAKPKPKGTP